MDYKELIKQLAVHGQSLAAYSDESLSRSLEDAATAIQTLLAERDAAIGFLQNSKSRCNCCMHNESSIHEYPCRDCMECGGMSDYWQWRGVQKENGHIRCPGAFGGTK